MKYLLMCEGQNEKALIDILINHEYLLIKRDDLLNRTVYFSRQIDKTPMVISALKLYDKKVEVWRIGDTLSDTLRIPPDFKNKIKNVNKYCTKPSIEILLIINEQKFQEYKKVSSSKSPKEFAKEYIIFNRNRYNNSTKFWEDYYKDRPEVLVRNILEYKNKKKNVKSKKEKYLADILK